jgi:hypothetical protein
VVTAAELVAPTVSPENLLLDARRVGPSRRSERARAALSTAASWGAVQPPRSARRLGPA